MTLDALLVALELLGTFVFSFDGALTAARVVRLDLVGVLTLGFLTALGGGVLRDLIIGATPPAAFTDWTYATVALAGAVLAFFVSPEHGQGRGRRPILALDAVGLSLFSVVGAQKALEFGLAAPAAAVLGVVTAVGGGTLRDVLIRRVPSVLTHDLYAVPAGIGAIVTVVAIEGGWYGAPAAALAAALCFAVRMLGVRLHLQVPSTRLPRE